jgi:thymidine phosphorylase
LPRGRSRPPAEGQAPRGSSQRALRFPSLDEVRAIRHRARLARRRPRKKEDTIDHAVGLEFHKRIGDRVAASEPLVTVFYNDESRFAVAQPLLAGCCEIGSEPPREMPRLVKRLIGESR